jgi:hypothetical protein
MQGDLLEPIRSTRIYSATAAALKDQGDQGGAARAEAKLTEIQDAIDGINRRAANIRAEHVYVISNAGAFGQHAPRVLPGQPRRST